MQYTKDFYIPLQPDELSNIDGGIIHFIIIGACALIAASCQNKGKDNHQNTTVGMNNGNLNVHLHGPTSATIIHNGDTTYVHAK